MKMYLTTICPQHMGGVAGICILYAACRLSVSQQSDIKQTMQDLISLYMPPGVFLQMRQISAENTKMRLQHLQKILAGGDAVELPIQFDDTSYKPTSRVHRRCACVCGLKLSVYLPLLQCTHTAACALGCAQTKADCLDTLTAGLQFFPSNVPHAGMQHSAVRTLSPLERTLLCHVFRLESVHSKPSCRCSGICLQTQQQR